VGHPELANLRPRFRIYFPSRKTVEQSRGGVDVSLNSSSRPSHGKLTGCQGAGTLFLQSKWWNQPTFPRDTLRECRSTRQGLLMHNKVMFVTGKSTTPWAYVGSANLSESAWYGLT
jgi:phosphatidylserine/phosphatidylglycerophosphate/cardiolipin synthase-like enzyme